MKKTFAYLFLIILTISMASCQFNNSAATNNDDLLIDYTSDKYVFDTVLYTNDSENSNIVVDEKSVNFDVEVFVDKSAKKTFDLEILNEKYTAEYVESAKLPLTGETVHTYSLREINNAKILIDRSGKIVKYVNIPIDRSFSTEQEYKDFIQNLVGETFNLSEYKYTCTTWHYVFFDNGMSSKVEEGFHICGENERFSCYSFYFDKYIGGIKTLEHVFAEFDDDSFSLEMYDWGYSSETFKQLLKETDNIENELNSYLQTHVQNDNSIEKFEITGQKMFVRNGIPYLQTTLTIDYTDSYGGGYNAVVKVISGYFPTKEIYEKS